MALPHYEMGQWACADLLKQIDAQPPYPVAHAMIRCPIVRRGSVAAPPVVIKPAMLQHAVPNRPGGEPSIRNHEHLAS